MIKMGKVDTSDLMMIITWALDTFFNHLNWSGPVEYIQPCSLVFSCICQSLSSNTCWRDPDQLEIRPFWKRIWKNYRAPLQLYFKWFWFQVFRETAHLYQHNSESSRSDGLLVLFYPFWGGTYKTYVGYQAKYGKKSSHVYLVAQYFTTRTKIKHH